MPYADMSGRQQLPTRVDNWKGTSMTSLMIRTEIRINAKMKERATSQGQRQKAEKRGVDTHYYTHQIQALINFVGELSVIGFNCALLDLTLPYPF